MENFAKTFSHEPLIRFSLDVNQMRHWQYFIDSGITVPSPITYGNRFKHVIPHPLICCQADLNKRVSAMTKKARLQTIFRTLHVVFDERTSSKSVL